MQEKRIIIACVIVIICFIIVGVLGKKIAAGNPENETDTVITTDIQQTQP